MGAIFRERVIAPPSAPLIATAADALAVTLNETGHVDIDHLAELLDRDPETALANSATAVFLNPRTEAWETDDAYLSGSVRTKLARRRGGGRARPQYARNVAALRLVQPEDLQPSDITARLGAPLIPVADIEAFIAAVMDTAPRGCATPSRSPHGPWMSRRSSAPPPAPMPPSRVGRGNRAKTYAKDPLPCVFGGS